MDIIQAATDTITAYIQGGILFLILYPDVQAKVLHEIQEIIPRGQKASYEDLKRFTNNILLRKKYTRNFIILNNLSQSDRMQNEFIVKSTDVFFHCSCPLELLKILIIKAI